MYSYDKSGVPVAAVIIEPIQAEGGEQLADFPHCFVIVTIEEFVVIFSAGDKHASPEFFQSLQQLCKKVCKCTCTCWYQNPVEHQFVATSSRAPLSHTLPS